MVFRFTTDVTNWISGCDESSNIPLNNLHWKVKVCQRYNENSVLVVDVRLLAYSVQNFPSWETAAQATVRLLPTENNTHIVSKQLPITAFTSSAPEHAINSFVSWDDFHKFFVNENRATFEIALSAENSAAVSMVQHSQTSDIEVIKTRLHIMLENVNQFGRTESSEVMVRGIKWRIVVETRATGVHVYLVANEQYLGRGASYPVNAIAKLFTYDRSAQPYVASFNHVYQLGSNTGGLNHLISWNEFIDESRKFVLDGKANLLIEFKAEEPKLSWLINEGPIQF